MEQLVEKDLNDGDLKEFQKNWKDLIHPRRLEKDEKVSNPTYAKFICEPLERGYGVTLGNSLRRVLLSSIQGPAVTSVNIDGVLHEFSTVTGVKEDVTEIILNLKSLNLEMHTYEPQILTLKFEGPGIVTAANIEENHQVTIINSDQYIATISEGGTLEMEMTVEMGKGYEPVERRGEVQKNIGNIPIDALFSPIRKVNYTVTNSRVGRRTDFEKLTLEIWTNGTILPEDALAYSAKIIKQQLSIFINFDETVFEDEEIVDDSQDIKGNEEVLFTLVEDIDLSARSLNCLRKANIVYLGELIQKSEEELLNLENFGKRSLVEIREKLEEMSLELGADINVEVFEQEKTNRLSTSEETE
ncbi:MAG: DNA-directed RNA polymerase subunit alpha [Thermodesulfobacteriota bacterium]